jgi:hypothetical protein
VHSQGNTVRVQLAPGGAGAPAGGPADGVANSTWACPAVGPGLGPGLNYARAPCARSPPLAVEGATLIGSAVYFKLSQVSRPRRARPAIGACAWPAFGPCVWPAFDPCIWPVC